VDKGRADAVAPYGGMAGGRSKIGPIVWAQPWRRGGEFDGDQAIVAFVPTGQEVDGAVVDQRGVTDRRGVGSAGLGDEVEEPVRRVDDSVEVVVGWQARDAVACQLDDRVLCCLVGGLDGAAAAPVDLNDDLDG
jgi:hypothetical protein